MVQIPILSGIGTRGADFTVSYPSNLVPVITDSGISKGFLRPAPGIETIANGGGANRGGYRWRDAHYRVMGNSLLRIDAAGAIRNLGTIAGTDWATFAEDFDRLAINAGGKLYYYNGTTLDQVTDPDLGTSLDVVWINGYFVSTDGEFLASSDITDPFSFNPLRYASSEVAPDPVVALQKLRSEIYAVNRYTIEIFGAVQNPGANFPFARIEGAQIMRGAIGSRACCEFMQTLAFLGSARTEPPSVWIISGAGQTTKLSTRQIDDALRGYDEETLATVVLESRMDRGHEFLYVHLPDQTLVFDGATSRIAEQPIWFTLRSGVPGGGYRARGFVWCYDQWNVADPFGTLIGRLTDDAGEHYGQVTTWGFQTPVLYNEGKGAQVHEIELVALTGNVALGNDPLIGRSYSTDGLTFSQTRYVRAGRQGERNKRIVWDRCGEVRNWRIERFTGDSRAHLAFARLEARVEPLA